LDCNNYFDSELYYDIYSIPILYVKQKMHIYVSKLYNMHIMHIPVIKAQRKGIISTYLPITNDMAEIKSFLFQQCRII